MDDIKSDLRRGRYYIGHIASMEETDVCKRAANHIEHLERALEPFSKMAGELFARNYDAEDVALMFRTPEGETVKLDFADFLVVRDALKQPLTACRSMMDHDEDYGPETCELCGQDVEVCTCGECGLQADGTCLLAGTEHCDWDCTHPPIKQAS